MSAASLETLGLHNNDNCTNSPYPTHQRCVEIGRGIVPIQAGPAQTDTLPPLSICIILTIDDFCDWPLLSKVIDLKIII